MPGGVPAPAGAAAPSGLIQRRLPPPLDLIHESLEAGRQVGRRVTASDAASGSARRLAAPLTADRA